MSGRAQVQLHAGCVAWRGRGALILGAAGRGKSALALQLMALGCDLVSDDRTDLHVAGDGLVAKAPPALHGLIEARGIGILQAEAADAAHVVLAVDLDRTETARFPPDRCLPLLGQSVPLVHQGGGAHFAAAILQYLKAGRASV